MQLLSNYYDRILADRYNPDYKDDEPAYNWQPGDKDKLDQLRDGIVEHIACKSWARQHDDDLRARQHDDKSNS